MKVYTYTKMIRTSDMRYPVYLRDYKSDPLVGMVSIGDFVYEEGLSPHGYYPVMTVEPPEGDVVTENPPIMGDDGRWHQSWSSRPFTEEENKQNFNKLKHDRIESASFNYSNSLYSGISVDGITYVAEVGEICNLLAGKELAKSGNVDSILIRRIDDTVEEHTPTEAIGKIDSILMEIGKLHQELLAYVRDVNNSKDIDSVPEIPEKFN